MAPISKTPPSKVAQTPSTSECSYVSSYCGTEVSSPEVVQQTQGNGPIDGGIATSISPPCGIYASSDRMLGPLLKNHGNSIIENSGPNLDMGMSMVKTRVDHNDCIDRCSSVIPSISTGSDEEAQSTSFNELAVNQEREIASQTNIEVDYDDTYSDEAEEVRAVEFNTTIRTEWIGTSQFFIKQGVAMQIDGRLDSRISGRKALIHKLSVTPYDPSIYRELSGIDNELGFTDIGAANAHKALLLVHAGLNLKAEFSYPLNLGDEVRKSVGRKIQSPTLSNVQDELQRIRAEAYSELLNGLLGSWAFWDGLTEAKKALNVFPNNEDLLESRAYLKEAFQDRHNGLLDAGQLVEDLLPSTRTGKIYQKQYPWMDEKLYMRSPFLLRDVNRKMGLGNCEVRPVIFDAPNSKLDTENEVSAKKGVMRSGCSLDVGPLGIFATRNINNGELIMVDKCLTGISDVPSSKFEHCDGCHGSLSMPYIHPSEIVRPKCCKGVAYCSKKCHDQAINGYHTVLCGKNWDWLYFESGTQETLNPRFRWRAVMFLRIIAIVLADIRAQVKRGKPKQHPLQHHLIARMSANYAPPHRLHPTIALDWQYFENVVAPTKILMYLGVNIFTDPDFTPEVIQTIYWRIENNANAGTTDLSISAPPLLNTHVEDKRDYVKGKYKMTSLNPHYLFFNHSCEPNVSWHGAIPNQWVSIELLKGFGGEMLKPGCSAVKCTAGRDIIAGEELKISYIGDPKGESGDVDGGRDKKRQWLEKWFEEGCGCDLCEMENEAEENWWRERNEFCGRDD